MSGDRRSPEIRFQWAAELIFDRIPFRVLWPQEMFLLKISPTQNCGRRGDHLAHDITGRRHAEGALRESEERYRRLVSIMPAAVYTCDAEGLITFFNQRAAEIWGREPRLRDPQDRYCGSFRLYRPNMTPLKYEQYPMAEAVLTGKYARDREILIERPDGKYLNASVNIDPLYNEHGQLAGAINVFRDITEQKQLWGGKPAPSRKDGRAHRRTHEKAQGLE
jgi:PAS domain-containing protein